MSTATHTAAMTPPQAGIANSTRGENPYAQVRLTAEDRKQPYAADNDGFGEHLLAADGSLSGVTTLSDKNAYRVIDPKLISPASTCRAPYHITNTIEPNSAKMMNATNPAR